MKINSIEQYKSIQRERQKQLDEMQKRKAARHLRKKAYDEATGSTKQAIEECKNEQIELQIEGAKDETTV
jgi:hypothetical protein